MKSAFPLSSTEPFHILCVVFLLQLLFENYVKSGETELRHRSTKLFSVSLTLCELSAQSQTADRHSD